MGAGKPVSTGGAEASGAGVLLVPDVAAEPDAAVEPDVLPDSAPLPEPLVDPDGSESDPVVANPDALSVDVPDTAASISVESPDVGPEDMSEPVEEPPDEAPPDTPPVSDDTAPLAPDVAVVPGVLDPPHPTIRGLANSAARRAARFGIRSFTIAITSEIRIGGVFEPVWN